MLEDVAADVGLLHHELEKGGLNVSTRGVETRDDFLQELEQRPPDVILSDHSLPSFDGFSALEIAHDRCPDTPFIFVTGSMGEEVAIDSLRSGATDYVLKGRLSKLVPAVKRGLRLADERARRRKAEYDLRESEENFRLLVEGIDEYAVYILNPQGRVTTWNAGAERIEGYRAQEIIGRRFHRFYTPEDVERKRPDQALAVATAEGRFQEEGWQMRKDGTQYWAHVIIAALRDEHGKLTGFSKIARDTTGRKEAEDQLRQQNAALEHRVELRTDELRVAREEMETFSHSISHDLRSPLIHIAGFVQLLQNDLDDKLDVRSRRHLRTIIDSTAQMGRMIADLLAFSRIGQAEIHKIQVDLNQVAKDVEHELQPDLQIRQVDWVIHELPKVSADPFLIRQVFHHLMSNALKFTRARKTARIEIGSISDEKEQIVFVRDNGVGFDMKYGDKLFGVFQRLHSVTEFNGVGTGLAQVRRIIQRHGGRTWAEGAVDAGATFSFSLPLIEGRG